MTEEQKAIQVIANDKVIFENPHPDVHVAKIPIANASWVKTSEGIVVIDTLLNRITGQKMKEKVDETGGPVKVIIYTHHHNDHVGGARVFLDDNPEIIGHRFLPEDLEKYRILREHRARIASIQFNVPFMPERQPKYVEPTKTYDTSMVFTLGDKTFELYHARAETDDGTWVYVPELKTAFVGDLIIMGFPNIGNPFKPTRFGLSWARALEAVREKSPEMVIAHGGRAVYKGPDAMELLNVNIEGIHSIHDQVVAFINQDMPVDEMIHAVVLPDHLKNHRFLKFTYSRPEFAVYNIYRWYHGYFDHNPAHLLAKTGKRGQSGDIQSHRGWRNGFQSLKGTARKRPVPTGPSGPGCAFKTGPGPPGGQKAEALHSGKTLPGGLLPHESEHLGVFHGSGQEISWNGINTI